MLTALQHKTLTLIHAQVSETGTAPSYRELKAKLGLASLSAVHSSVRILEERGFIRKLKHRARAIEILKLPPGIEKGCCPTCGRSYA